MPFGYRALVAGLLASVWLCACVPASGLRATPEAAELGDALAAETIGEQTGLQPPPVRVQFRDLFMGPDPSDRAIALSGSEIEIVGYLTPPQAFPFRVLVGQPSETCPYCEPPDEENDDVLPFLLVFGDPGEMDFGFRSRLRVTGVLQAQRNGVGPDGRKLEMRLVDAVVEPDARYIDPREKTGGRIAMTANTRTHNVDGSDN